ncbi:MAG: hypothetical protein NDI69_01790 [Bacteriovoracaceae bacterium]|nr:hypothetical protein [Bacteriovoracaceae bacterium]
MRKITILFFITFFLSYFLLQTFSKLLIQRQEEIDAKQTRILQENVRDRFKLFLKLPLSIGTISAELFSRENDLLKRKFTNAAYTLLDLNTEILGINVVDSEGMIIRVFPPEVNSGAVGKISQNFVALKESYHKGKNYFFSPPFDLYQGLDGFAIYLPIVTNQTLRGWVAIVINSERFFDKFKLFESTDAYHLIIKDKASGRSYFATSAEPTPGTKVYQTVIQEMGRDLVFESWRVDGSSFILFPQYGNLIIAFMLALIVAFMTRLQEQKKKARNQLSDISSLLTLTSKEALSNLVDMHSEINQLEQGKDQEKICSKNINYITNLIEQIDLLQTMTQSKEGAHHEVHQFLPLLERQLDLLNDIIEKKHLVIQYSKEKLTEVTINANGWLIQNSVLSNVLSHAIIYSQAGSVITIENQSSDETHVITFHIKTVHQKGPESNSLSLDRRMEVAKRILQIYEGELYIQNDLGEGMIIRIKLPSY